MLPTPDTSHVSYSRVYEPAEDSFLFLDTFSSASEVAFLQQHFEPSSSSPSLLVVEVGTGSGVILGFLNAHSLPIFGTRAVLTLGIDVNAFACSATVATVTKAVAENPDSHGSFLDTMTGDLMAPLRKAVVDILIFNPPYVPTDDLPVQDSRLAIFEEEICVNAAFKRDSCLLSLSYAGGKDGTEITNRFIKELPGVLSTRGCAYILLCAANKPEEVTVRIRALGSEWRVMKVGDSGKQAGWERLQIIRVWRDYVGT